MGLLSMMGLPDDEDEQWKDRQQQLGAFAPDKPTYVERMGRDFTDVGEQLAQAYYNAKVWDPTQAEQYRKQRAEDERLYQKGFSYGHTLDGQPLPENLQGMVPDLWRTAGQVAAMTPIWAIAAAPTTTAQGLQYIARNGIGGAASGELMKQAALVPDLRDYMFRKRP